MSRPLHLACCTASGSLSENHVKYRSNNASRRYSDIVTDIDSRLNRIACRHRPCGVPDLAEVAEGKYYTEANHKDRLVGNLPANPMSTKRDSAHHKCCAPRGIAEIQQVVLHPQRTPFVFLSALPDDVWNAPDGKSKKTAACCDIERRCHPFPAEDRQAHRCQDCQDVSAGKTHSCHLS